MNNSIRVLMITSEWPTKEHPHSAPFVVRQANSLRAAGVDVEVFHFRGGQNPVRYLRAWKQVRKKLKENTYDVVHAQWGQSGLLALPKRLPLVVTYRGADLEGIIGREGKHTFAGYAVTRLGKVIALMADQIIVVSDSLGRRLPKGRPYHIIPSGLDLEMFVPQDKMAAREALNLPKDRQLIFFGGNPDVPRKRLSLAEQAVALLNEGDKVELVVPRGVPHREMPQYMNACDVLVLTSKHEGSPNVVKEALACNLPVVAVPVGDVRERLAGLPGCVACQDDQPETIAAGLKKVLSDTAPFEGRKAVEELDERIITQKVINIYRDVIQGWHKRKATT